MAPIIIPKAPTLKSPSVSFYTLSNSTEVERMELVALLLNSFQFQSLSPEIALSKMLSISSSCIPELEKYITSNSGGVITSKPISYGAFVERLAANLGPEGEDPDDWGFSSIDPGVLTITNKTAICASAAVAWMTYAKSAGESSRKALEEARPKMMKGKYKLLDEEVLLFPGETLGPGLEFLDQVNLGFGLYPVARHLSTAFFISLRSSSVYLPPHADPFMLVFDMLKNTGMTHVGAIVRFVEMHPWVLRVPELAADFTYFAGELSKSALIPADIRPYHRLLVPQTDYLFVTSNLRPLVAVAGDFIQEVDSSFKNYIYGATAYTDLVERVRARAPISTVIPDVSSLEQLFKVKAQDLKDPDILLAVSGTAV